MSKDGIVENIQKERGSVYGKFECQAQCVGSIIGACIKASNQRGSRPCNDKNDNSLDSTTLGAIAYVAIKLARYAVNPSHEDTLIDLESYANLIKKMESNDVEK